MYENVENLNDPTARGNFRVLVICPEEVERLDLSNPGRTRWVFAEREDDGEWEEIELWP
jgi:hypothetical protein